MAIGTTALQAPPAPMNRERFARWLSARSYALLRPVCAMALAVISVMLAVIDPALFAAGVWGEHPLHGVLVGWHMLAWLAFAGFLRAAGYPRPHLGRQRVLGAFYMACGALFSSFAFISWSLSGDLSIYAIFLLAMACVFAGQGRLRTLLGLGSAAGVSLAILWFDPRDTFRTSGAALNLLALAIVSGLLDAFVLRLNQALFAEREQVRHERARAEQVLHRALPRRVAESLQRTRRSGAVRFDDLCVLFIDIVGFTRHCADRPPEQVLGLLDDLFSTFDRLAAAHGVEKIKTMGDAYLAVADGQLKAVLAMAQDCVHAMGAFRPLGLDIRCGVHVGPAVAGVIGLTRYLYDVWGDAVNVASRMESTGAPGRIHVSDAVARRMAGEFRFESRGEREIDGRGRMQTHWLLMPPARSQRATESSPGKSPR